MFSEPCIAVMGVAISSAIQSGVDAASAAIRNMWNSVAYGLSQGIYFRFNEIKWGPITLPSISARGTVNLPRLARGGVVDGPTPAIIGEDGSEAVVPLENNTEWIDKIVAKLKTSPSNNQPLQLTVKIGEDTIATKIIDLINEKTQMSGRNAILV